jgi:hypothetical protein
LLPGQLEKKNPELARHVASTNYFRLHYIKQGMVCTNKQYWDTLIPSDCTEIEREGARDARIAKNVAQNLNKYSDKIAQMAEINGPINNKICYKNKKNKMNDYTSRNLKNDMVGLFNNHYGVADKIPVPSNEIGNSQYQKNNNSLNSSNPSNRQGQKQYYNYNNNRNSASNQQNTAQYENNNNHNNNNNFNGTCNQRQNNQYFKSTYNRNEL